MANPPKIGPFEVNDTLMLKPSPNGGWVVLKRNPAPIELGAYTTAKEMLDALSSALVDRPII